MYGCQIEKNKKKYTTFRQLKQEDCKFEARLGCIIRPCLKQEVHIRGGIVMLEDHSHLSEMPYFISGNVTKELKSGGVNELFTSGISELPPVGGCGVWHPQNITQYVSRWPQGRQTVQVLFLRVRGLEGWGEGRERSAPGALSVGYCLYIKELKGRRKGKLSMYGCRL